jgi:hypothetical protein
MDRTAGMRLFACRLQLYPQSLIFGQQRHGRVIVELGHVERFRRNVEQRHQFAIFVVVFVIAILLGQLVRKLVGGYQLRRFRRRIVEHDAARHRHCRQQCTIKQSGREQRSQHVCHTTESDRPLIA